MQSNHRRIAAMRVTLGLALQAKLEAPSMTALRLAVIAGDREFAAGDPLRVALHDFADRFPAILRDPQALRAAGEVLFSAVRRASWPQPALRADIEG